MLFITRMNFDILFWEGVLIRSFNSYYCLGVLSAQDFREFSIGAFITV